MKKRKENIMELNGTMPCAPSDRTLYYDRPAQVKFLDFDLGDNPCVEVNNYTPILFEDIKKSIEGD